MDFWSRPVGRLTGVVVATVGVVVAVVAFVAVGSLVAGNLSDDFNTFRGPEIISNRFPRECLDHMGDLTPHSGDVVWSIVWLGTESELITCNKAMDPEEYEASQDPDYWKTLADLRLDYHESDEFEPPTLEGLPLPEECVLFYDDVRMWEENSSQWVFAFEGTYEDFRVCKRAMFRDALNDPESTIHTIEFRGERLLGGFQFVTATPTQ